MTQDEARMVAGIMLGADGGCYHCAAELISDLKKRFPEHAQTIQAVYDTEWPPE